MPKLTLDDALFDDLRIVANESLQNLFTRMERTGSREGKLNISISVEMLEAETVSEETGELLAVQSPEFRSKVSYSVNQKSAPVPVVCGTTDKFLKKTERGYGLEDCIAEQRSFFEGGR